MEKLKDDHLRVLSLWRQSDGCGGVYGGKDFWKRIKSEKEYEWWTMTVVMMGEMSLDEWDEKSGKKNDQDQVDGMRQEVDSKGKIYETNLLDS